MHFQWQNGHTPLSPFFIIPFINKLASYPQPKEEIITFCTVDRDRDYFKDPITFEEFENQWIRRLEEGTGCHQGMVHSFVEPSVKSPETRSSRSSSSGRSTPIEYVPSTVVATPSFSELSTNPQILQAGVNPREVKFIYDFRSDEFKESAAVLSRLSIRLLLALHRAYSLSDTTEIREDLSLEEDFAASFETEISIIHQTKSFTIHLAISYIGEAIEKYVERSKLDLYLSRLQNQQLSEEPGTVQITHLSLSPSELASIHPRTEETSTVLSQW